MDELDRIILASSSDTPQQAPSTPAHPAASLLDSLADLDTQPGQSTAQLAPAQPKAPATGAATRPDQYEVKRCSVKKLEHKMKKLENNTQSGLPGKPTTCNDKSPASWACSACIGNTQPQVL